MKQIIRIAVIEDEPVTSMLFADWLEELSTADRLIEVERLLTRDAAEAAVSARRYDLICLDIEMNHERNAGIGIIKAILRRDHGPVLVISGLPADTYQEIMTELDAWDYLIKPLDPKHKSIFHSSVLRGLRQHRGTEPVESKNGFEIDPLSRTSARYNGQRINLPLTGQRIVKLLMDRPNQLVKSEALYELIPYGHNSANLRAHIQVIRNAIRDVDPEFNAIQNVPMAGYMWRQ